MANDEYTEAAIQRLRRLEAERAQAVADMASYRAAGDTDSMGDCAERIAEVDMRSQNLRSLHQQYVASQQAPEKPQLTQEERHAKPWDRCDWSDTWEWASNSKHGVDPDAFKAGMQYVTSRKARGE